MKRSFLLLTILFCTFNFVLQAQNEEEMQAWMEYMSPSWGHEVLARAVGDWTYKMTYWSTPDSDPMSSSGTAKGEMILGGRYLKLTTSGEVWGMKMEGMSLEAFDNAKQRFYSIWIDNLGTGMMYSDGSYDEATGEIIYEGHMVDPMTSQNISVMNRTKFVGEEMHFEMWLDHMGMVFKSMEIVYTRK